MSTKSVSLGPWGGIDNVNSTDSRTFQPPGELEKRLATLVTASNVDLDDDGWVKSRQALAMDKALMNGLGSWTADGRLFFQDGSILYERIGTATDIPLISGLEARAKLTAHWRRIYVTDGANHWEIDGTVIRTWGLPVPTVVLSPGNGNLEAGTYLVQVTFVDARGNEGGTSDIASATLTTATGIEVAVRGFTQAVVAANIYVSRRDQKYTSFCQQIMLGNLPYLIQSDDETAADPPKTEQMTGPINNAAGVFSFRAFLLMWRDNVVFRSEAAEPSLFHGDNLMQFNGAVTACEGVAGGMWIGTEAGLWWVQGNDPDKWIPVRKTFSPVARGSVQIQGSKIPRAQTNERLALFVTESGLVAGTADGQDIHLTDGVYTFDGNQRASISYSERGDLRQILIGLVN